VSDPYPTIGANIRTYRKARGMSQEALAEAIEQTRTSLVNIEQGRQRVPIHTLMQLAAALDVSIGMLLPVEWFDQSTYQTVAALKRRIVELETKAEQVAELAEWLYRETR
jgi:transcriptional regulator with XRE-family HTH domain